jgi:hypothetical protein
MAAYLILRFVLMLQATSTTDAIERASLWIRRRLSAVLRGEPTAYDLKQFRDAIAAFTVAALILATGACSKREALAVYHSLAMSLKGAQKWNGYVPGQRTWAMDWATYHSVTSTGAIALLFYRKQPSELFIGGQPGLAMRRFDFNDLAARGWCNRDGDGIRCMWAGSDQESLSRQHWRRASYSQSR